MSVKTVGAGEDFSGTIKAGDTVKVDFLGVADDVTIQGGTLDLTTFGGLTTPGIDGGEIDFSGTGGLLALNILNDASNALTPIGGFAQGDGISIEGVSTHSLIATVGDEVLITDGLTTESLLIKGAAHDDFTLVDVAGKTTLEIVCFLAGTTIATPDGGRAIETLRAGDIVLTAEGSAAPVRWLGRQTVATRFADSHRVAPIRIRAGALDACLPARDLLVSPDHALMIEGVFVQAGALVNGVSITREDAHLPETLVYFHVELADHALILAEGVQAETFIDNVDRLAFDNWDEHQALDAATVPMSEMPHARAKAQRQVPQALRARLLARGQALYGAALAAVA